MKTRHPRTSVLYGFISKCQFLPAAGAFVKLSQVGIAATKLWPRIAFAAHAILLMTRHLVSSIEKVTSSVLAPSSDALATSSFLLKRVSYNFAFTAVTATLDSSPCLK